MIEIRTTPPSPRLQKLVSDWESALAERNIIAAENAEDALRELSREIGSMNEKDWHRLLSAAAPTEYTGGCTLDGECFRELCLRAHLPAMDAGAGEIIILLPK